MDKRKVLLTAAIAGLFAAGAVMNQAAPALADEAAPAAGQTGDKASCKGGSCKGEEGAAKTDAAAPAGDKKSCKSEEGAAKGKKAGKHKGKAKKKKAAEAPAS
jgi:hypothetical protein